MHAELEQLGGVWTIADDGLSRNGTFVNGERIRGRRRLAERDTVSIGATRIVFREPRVAPRPGATMATTRGSEDVRVAISAAQRRVLVALARPCLTEGAFATPATNREIADELCLTVDPVRTRLRPLWLKYGIQDLPQERQASLVLVGGRARLAAGLLAATGATTALHFAGLLVAAWRAIGEPGQVRPAGFIGVAGGLLVLAAGVLTVRR